jgi:NADH dehydrogenase
MSRLFDRNNHHTFHPLLYQVALAVLSPGDIAQPIRSILSNHKNVEVLMEEACQIDVVAQTVTLKSGIKLPYDFLIVATGLNTQLLRKRRVGPHRARPQNH